jgi:5-methylcytosine-specific restriction endonuclease McrA
MNKITIEELIERFGETPVCYLTGQPIDINHPRTYQFDHKVPSSRGGTNTIENLGICTKQANQAKSDMTHDEFVEFCKSVLIHHGYTVSTS